MPLAWGEAGATAPLILPDMLPPPPPDNDDDDDDNDGLHKYHTSNDN